MDNLNYKSRITRGRSHQRIDTVREAIIGRSCLTCGETMTRNRFKNGELEANSVFYKRKTCHGIGRKCSKCRIEFLRKKPRPRKRERDFCIVCNKKLCPRGKLNEKSTKHLCYKCLVKSGFFKRDRL